MPWPQHRFAAFLLAGYGALFAVLAIDPVSRSSWALENALAVLFVVLLVLTRNVFPLSRLSYTLLFVFLALHTFGAHYEYSNVPYDEWSRALLSRGVNDLLGWDRNHFDRFVHLAYGLLLAYPARELFLRVADARGFWGYLLPVLMMMSTSVVYELIEWAAAVAFGGDLGVAYLGTQGDEWDAQKDMLLATTGAIVAMAVVAGVNLKFERDFTRAFVESLRVKRRAPLGEDKLREHLEDRRRS